LCPDVAQSVCQPEPLLGTIQAPRVVVHIGRRQQWGVHVERRDRRPSFRPAGQEFHDHGLLLQRERDEAILAGGEPVNAGGFQPGPDGPCGRLDIDLIAVS